jgi:hypothetical protein
MGGMVAQRVAVLAPSRLLSLSSIMSSSGARGLPEASPAVTRVLLSRPAGKGVQAAVDHTARLLKAIGSPGFPTPDAELREKSPPRRSAAFTRRASCARWWRLPRTARAPRRWPR